MSAIGTIAAVVLLSGGHAEGSPWTRFCGPGGPDKQEIVCFCAREGGTIGCPPGPSVSIAEQQRIQQELQDRADGLRRRLERAQSEQRR
jgi:hypothetical protein